MRFVVSRTPFPLLRVDMLKRDSTLNLGKKGGYFGGFANALRTEGLISVIGSSFFPVTASI
jgi:hypothetical protein